MDGRKLDDFSSFFVRFVGEGERNGGDSVEGALRLCVCDWICRNKGIDFDFIISCNILDFFNLTLFGELLTIADDEGGGEVLAFMLSKIKTKRRCQFIGDQSFSGSARLG